MRISETRSSESDLAPDHNDYDVYFGRKPAVFRSTGNQYLKERVRECIPRYESYHNDRAGAHKSILITAMVDEINKKGGRFLAWIPTKKEKKRGTGGDGEWVEVDKGEARKKVSHLFRDLGPRIRTAQTSSQLHVSRPKCRSKRNVSYKRVANGRSKNRFGLNTERNESQQLNKKFSSKPERNTIRRVSIGETKNPTVSIRADSNDDYEARTLSIPVSRTPTDSRKNLATFNTLPDSIVSSCIPAAPALTTVKPSCSQAQFLPLSVMPPSRHADGLFHDPIGDDFSEKSANAVGSCAMPIHGTYECHPEECPSIPGLFEPISLNHECEEEQEDVLDVGCFDVSPHDTFECHPEECPSMPDLLEPLSLCHEYEEEVLDIGCFDVSRPATPTEPKLTFCEDWLGQSWRPDQTSFAI